MYFPIFEVIVVQDDFSTCSLLFSSFQAKRLITNEFAAIKVIKLEPGMCVYLPVCSIQCLSSSMDCPVSPSYMSNISFILLALSASAMTCPFHVSTLLYAKLYIFMSSFLSFLLCPLCCLLPSVFFRLFLSNTSITLVFLSNAIRLWHAGGAIREWFDVCSLLSLWWN